MRVRLFYGWIVAGATALVAMLAFGLGFYGITVYVASLQRMHGWSASALSAAVTVYYVAGALVTAGIPRAYARRGPRAVVACGAVAMAAAVVAIGLVKAPWQLVFVFLLMALGWGAMSGAAINIIVAPWFERRRGLAVSLAFNGATLGGVLVAPALLLLIEAIGLAAATAFAGTVLAVVVVPVAIAVFRRGPDELGLGPDGDPAPRRGAPLAGGRSVGDALRTWRFWSVSAPFALGLAAQVGILTHLVPLVAPLLGPTGAARALGVTTTAAIAARLITGLVVDRMNARVVSSATLVVQMLGVTLLALATDRLGPPALVTAGCVLFGAGVGNLTTLPGLILAAEWPRERFAALVGLAVGINQMTFAFGPSLVGIVHDRAGSYPLALAVCIVLQAAAAATVAWPSRTR